MTKKVQVVINVTEQERDSIKRLARNQGYTITSDYIRSLIMQNALENGFDLSFDVDRGGNRYTNDD
jgi:hypothetical protein